MLNLEIKAHTRQPDRIKSILENLGADYRGVDHQIDTYFYGARRTVKITAGKYRK